MNDGLEKSQDVSPLMTLVGTAIGVAAGTLVAQLLGPLDTITLLAGTAAGAIVGFIVQRAAKKRGEPKLGSTAMIACTGSGAVLGLVLAIPVGLGFYVALRRRGEGAPPPAPPVP